MIAALKFSILKPLVVLLFLFLILIAAYPVWAQDATRGGTTRRGKVQERVETRKENVKERVETGGVNRTRRENTTQRIDTMKQRIASREAALKAKLQDFKDKRKAQVAERVNTNLNRINQQRTEQMLKHLNRMSELLSKLENRINQKTPDIKDPTAAKTAIASAKEVISVATNAVNTQAENDYTIDVTSEAAIKSDAQKMREKLHTDLQATRKTVIDAKKAVSNAVRVAKSGSAVKEGTISGQQ